MSNSLTDDPLIRALRQFKGELATGYVARRQTFEDVRVTCHKCGGVTVVPVLLDDPRRLVPCAHCGTEI